MKDKKNIDDQEEELIPVTLTCPRCGKEFETNVPPIVKDMIRDGECNIKCPECNAKEEIEHFQMMKAIEERKEHEETVMTKCAKCGKLLILNVIPELRETIETETKVICDQCAATSEKKMMKPIIAFTRDGLSIVFNEFISESDILDFNDIAAMAYESWE